MPLQFGVPAIMFNKLLLGPVLFVFSSFSVTAATVAYYRFEDGSQGGIVSRVTDSGPNHLDGMVDSSQPIYFSNDVPPFPASGGFCLNASGDHNFARVPHSANAVDIPGFQDYLDRHCRFAETTDITTSVSLSLYKCGNSQDQNAVP